MNLKIVKSYLQLVRFPAVFTALADIFAGYFTVAQGDIVWRDLGLLLFASCKVYWAGMVLNDYFDYETDLKERPNRPLPSGAIPRNRALFLGIFFSCFSILAAGMVGIKSLIIALILVIAVFLYDGITKEIAGLGAFNMGLCRGLNITLGMSVVNIDVIHNKLPIAFILMIYIILVTQLSKGEVSEPALSRSCEELRGGTTKQSNLSKGSRRVYGVVTITGIIGLTIALIYLFFSSFFPQTTVFFLFMLAGFLMFVLSGLVRFIQQPIPSNIGKAVKRCLIAIIMLDSCFIAGAVGITVAVLVLLALLVPSIMISRLMYIT